MAEGERESITIVGGESREYLIRHRVEIGDSKGGGGWSYQADLAYSFSPLGLGNS